MTTIHDVIYLQSDGCTDEESEFYGTTTWCEDMINDTDIKYIRAEAAEARVADLERVLRMVEWEFYNDGLNPSYRTCLWCETMNGHSPDCPRQAVLTPPPPPPSVPERGGRAQDYTRKDD